MEGRFPEDVIERERSVGDWHAAVASKTEPEPGFQRRLVRASERHERNADFLDDSSGVGLRHDEPDALTLRCLASVQSKPRCSMCGDGHGENEDASEDRDPQRRTLAHIAPPCGKRPYSRHGCRSRLRSPSGNLPAM